MRKITLSFLAIAMVTTSVTTVCAQENVDVTPPRYVFATQPVGPFLYDGVASVPQTSNASPSMAAALSDLGGYTYLMGWEQFYAENGVDKGNTAYVRQMSNVVDLGGEVGKVLCFKGDQCSNEVFPYGVKPTSAPGAGSLGWPGIAFYMGSKIKGADYVSSKTYTARLTITWRACLPADDYSEEKAAFKLRMNDYSINTKTFLLLGDEMKAISAETEEENVWCRQEADFSFTGDNQNVPLLIKFGMELGELSRKSTLLIKEIKLVINPTGTAVMLEPLTLSMNPPTSSVRDEVLSSVSYLVDGDNIIVNNLANERIVLYNTLGATISTFNAVQSTETITVKENGIFILKVGDKSFKVVK